jgi:hypothetical protein
MPMARKRAMDNAYEIGSQYDQEVVREKARTKEFIERVQVGRDEVAYEMGRLQAEVAMAIAPGPNVLRRLRDIKRAAELLEQGITPQILSSRIRDGTTSTTPLKPGI